MATKCTHTEQAQSVKPKTDGYEECLAAGETWVQARRCLVCGHVGCCDSSKGHHATRQFEETGHAIMRSVEPGQSWSWCYVDKIYF
jgi:hypothetical protein